MSGDDIIRWGLGAVLVVIAYYLGRVAVAAEAILREVAAIRRHLHGQ